MTRGNEVFKMLQSKARSAASKTSGHTPTQEYLIRHLLESFLDRLNRSNHGNDFVLKGGVLLSAYGVRRPTKDVDANAISADVTAPNLRGFQRMTVSYSICQVSASRKSGNMPLTQDSE